MTWVRKEDTQPLHPKFLRLSDGAYRLWDHAVAYCNRTITDGLIAKDLVASLNHHGRWSAKQIAGFIVELTTVAAPYSNGLWSDEGACFRVHDYDHHQAEAMSDRVNRKRDHDRERKRLERERRDTRTTVTPGHAMESKENPAGSVKESLVPSRPVPSRPEGSTSYSDARESAPPPKASGRAKKPKPPSQHERAVADARVLEALALYREVHATGDRWKSETKEAHFTRAEHVFRALEGIGRDAATLDEVKSAIRGNAADEWHRERGKHELEYVLRTTKIAGFIAEDRGATIAPVAAVKPSAVSEAEARVGAAHEAYRQGLGLDGTTERKAELDAARLALSRLSGGGS